MTSETDFYLRLSVFRFHTVLVTKLLIAPYPGLCRRYHSIHTSTSTDLRLGATYQNKLRLLQMLLPIDTSRGRMSILSEYHHSVSVTLFSFLRKRIALSEERCTRYSLNHRTRHRLSTTSVLCSLYRMRAYSYQECFGDSQVRQGLDDLDRRVRSCPTNSLQKPRVHGVGLSSIILEFEFLL